jgi:hypothetical protein
MGTPREQATTESANGIVSGYGAPDGEYRLASYGVLVAGFNVAVAASLLAIRRSGRELPDRVAAQDVLLLGAATHKLSRVIAKDRVTSVLRAPFAEYEGSGGPAEVEEKPRGGGLRRTVGELMTCPYCLDQWVASALVLGLVAAPRTTRVVASLFTTVAVSDFLQVAYKAAERRGLERD